MNFDYSIGKGVASLRRVAYHGPKSDVHSVCRDHTGYEQRAMRHHLGDRRNLSMEEARFSSNPKHIAH